MQSLVILIAFTATAVPMAAQSSGTTRIRMLDRLAQQASSNSDPSELIPKGENGRPPAGLSIMLRIYFL